MIEAKAVASPFLQLYNSTARRRSALLITLTELTAIAAAAIIGESKSPRLG